MKRRRFIKTIGLTGAAILAGPGGTIAGPFKLGDFSGFQVPADKKLDLAIDGQAGTVLRIYREHRMSGDDLFLRENWGKIKKAVQYILRHDANKDGLTDGQQPNTLDADWFGDIAWIAGLCLAAGRCAAPVEGREGPHGSETIP